MKNYVISSLQALHSVQRSQRFQTANVSERLNPGHLRWGGQRTHMARLGTQIHVFIPSPHRPTSPKHIRISPETRDNLLSCHSPTLFIFPLQAAGQVILLLREPNTESSWAFAIYFLFFAIHPASYFSPFIYRVTLTHPFSSIHSHDFF